MDSQCLFALARFGGFPLRVICSTLTGRARVIAVVILGQCAGTDLWFFRQLLEAGDFSLQGLDLYLLFLEVLLQPLVG